MYCSTTANQASVSHSPPPPPSSPPPPPPEHVNIFNRKTTTTTTVMSLNWSQTSTTDVKHTKRGRHHIYCIYVSHSTAPVTVLYCTTYYVTLYLAQRVLHIWYSSVPEILQYYLAEKLTRFHKLFHSITEYCCVLSTHRVLRVLQSSWRSDSQNNNIIFRPLHSLNISQHSASVSSLSHQDDTDPAPPNSTSTHTHTPSARTHTHTLRDKATTSTI